MIASGLETVPTHELIPYLKKYTQQEAVEQFVIGNPKNLDGTATDATEMVKECVRILNKNFPNIPVIKLDERFTSKIAYRSMVEGGLTRKQRMDKALIDEVSATILLQDYLRSI